jgi:hypothetical protein
MTKYSKIFGKVEVLSVDKDITVVRLENGTEKRLLTAVAILSDMPVEVIPPAAQIIRKSKGEKKRAKDKKVLANTPDYVLRFENADGTRNNKAYNDFLEERERAKWSSKSL